MNDQSVLTTQTCFVGWRGWTIMHPGYLTTQQTVWVPNERTEATCNVREHEGERIPYAGCSCGIYAFNRPEYIRRDGYQHQHLLGEVWLWGKVVEHTMGYKAEYAYPKALYFCPNSTQRTLTESTERYITRCEYIAFRYGIPFQLIDSSHPIFQKTEREIAEEARERAREAAARAMKAMGVKEYNKRLKEAAMKMPAKHPGLYKSLWDEIEANAEIEARKRMGGI